MLWGGGFNILGVYIVLFVLWIICLFRDLIMVYGKTKEYDDILLFLGIGILIQVILTGILPYMNENMQTNCVAAWVFWFPDVYNPNTNAIKGWVDANYLLGFRVAATGMVILAILPMILDLYNTEEHVNLIAIIIIDIVFILPFLWLAYVWGGVIGLPLTFLFAVLLFIILLLLTRER